ncbi:hypothetical protein ACFSKN_18615 [Mariniflexile gromovii]|uniref:Uncharacterized protein n=1 Tax=Mariniflexile gromovii TaxID=362523 RepID=A0ABS4BUQ2_9FLAO|nr:hypothetical protein [Mariniflexile gromovii]MBP0904297.1 hypothetical protein [Mariniflexile gromovii]
MAFVFAIGCNTISNNKKLFTITKIEQGKDGQTLYIRNSENKTYTTVISIPNGNFVEVIEGDRIQIDIQEIIESDPPIIISNHIMVLDSTN